MSGLGFWNERFWLPNNITWADLRDTSLDKYPQIEDLAMVIPLALVLCGIRVLFERLVAQPIGTCIGICPRGARKPYPNAILERVFLTITQRPDEKRLKGLEKQLDCWNQYRIKQWFALRRAQLRPSKMSKFKESLFKLMYYTGIVGYGLYVFSEEEFFYDLAKCWKNYPFQPLNGSIQNYYTIQLSFYVSLVVAQMIVVRRKAFRHLLMHHLITIVLMVLSYVDNFIRIGCIILIAHDIADVWLETVKLLNYTKCGRLTHVVFTIFAAYFIATRLIYFPLWIINSTLVQSLWLPNLGFFPAYVIFNALLLSLLALHVYWAIVYFRIGLDMLYATMQTQQHATNTKQQVSVASQTAGLSLAAPSNEKFVSTLYSDSGMSETELNMCVSDFNPTYWFRLMPAAASGTVSGNSANGTTATLNGIFPGNINNSASHINSHNSSQNSNGSGSLSSGDSKTPNGPSANNNTIRHRNNSGKKSAANSSFANSESPPRATVQNGIHVSSTINGHVVKTTLSMNGNHVPNGHTCH